MTTIRAIAEQSRVSATTVSLVLNGRGKISSETRRRVTEVADRLGYRRRSNESPATGLRTRHVVAVNPVGYVDGGRTIHLLTTEWLRGIRPVVAEEAANLSVFLGGHDVETDLIFRDAVENGEVDGVLLFGDTLATDRYLKWLTDRGCRVVTSSRTSMPDERHFSAVVPDNFYGCQEMARYLTELGHRAVAFIKPALRLNWKYDRRLSGLKAGLSEASARLTGVAEVDLARGTEEVARACRAALERGATAIVGGNDGVARLAVDALDAMGVAVPQQMSVVGFEDMGGITRSGLRLTSVGYDKSEVGCAAAKLLFRLIDNSDRLSAATLTIRTHLAIHDTVAPPPLSSTAKRS